MATKRMSGFGRFWLDTNNLRSYTPLAFEVDSPPAAASPLAMAKCLSQSIPGFSAPQGLPQRSPVMLKTARFPSICVSLAIAVVALPIRAAATPNAEPSSRARRGCAGVSVETRNPAT
jgi:hypothetical protein